MKPTAPPSPRPFMAVDNIALGTRLLRRKEVELKTGLSRAAIYAAMRAGTFPRAIPLGTHSVAWLELEIDQWIADRLEERNRALRAATGRQHFSQPWRTRP